MKTISKILVATDFSPNSEQACEYALELAKKFNSSLFVLHVINEPVDLRGFYVPHISFDELEKEIEKGAENMLEKLCNTAFAGYGNYEKAVTSGVPYEEILRKATEINASMIVLGTHGRQGLDHLIFGSTAERVVRTAPCPVLTVRLPNV
jgi:universal stress protein A